MKAKYREYLAYLESEHWKALRKLKLDATGRICQCCGKRGKIHVHHIRYRKYYDCTLDDLAVLNEDCHNDFHFALKMKKDKPENYELPQIIALIQWYRDTKEHEKRQAEIKKRRRTKHEYYERVPRNRFKRFKKRLRSGTATLNKLYAEELLKELSSIVNDWPNEPVDEIVNLICNFDATEQKEPEEVFDVEMPEGDPIVLTSELIEKCRTEKNGFTNATIIAFGMTKHDLKSGWVQKLHGQSIPREAYKLALRGKFIYRMKLASALAEEDGRL